MATPEEYAARITQAIEGTLRLRRAERYHLARDVCSIIVLSMGLSSLPMPMLIPTIWDTIQRPYYIIAALVAVVGLLFTLLLYHLKRQNDKDMNELNKRLL